MRKDLIFVVNRLKYLPKGNGIVGELMNNGKRICYTLERTYDANKESISCILNGLYVGYIRDRGGVKKENKEWRIELIGVLNREYIQFHRGTRPSHSNGCILVGSAVTEEGLTGDYTGWIRLLNTVYTHFGVSDLKYLRNSRMEFQFQGLNIPEHI